MLENILINGKEHKILYVMDASEREYYTTHKGFLLVYNLHPSRIGNTAKINEILKQLVFGKYAR